jgi:hypothetical protein
MAGKQISSIHTIKKGMPIIRHPRFIENYTLVPLRGSKKSKVKRQKYYLVRVLPIVS